MFDSNNTAFNISKDSLITIVEKIITETDGAELYQAKGIKLAEKISPKFKRSAVKIKNQNDVLSVYASIVIKKGQNTPALCEAMQKNIKKSIQEMTGAVVSRVCITVEDCIS